MEDTKLRRTDGGPLNSTRALKGRCAGHARARNKTQLAFSAPRSPLSEKRSTQSTNSSSRRPNRNGTCSTWCRSSTENPQQTAPSRVTATPGRDGAFSWPARPRTRLRFIRPLALFRLSAPKISRSATPPGRYPVSERMTSAPFLLPTSRDGATFSDALSTADEIYPAFTGIGRHAWRLGELGWAI
jgi:hypothetical protein